MSHHPPSFADILAAKTATAMPSAASLPATELRHYFQAIDNMIRVFAFKPDDEVLFLHHGRLHEAGPAADFFAGPGTAEARAFLGGDLLW